MAKNLNQGRKKRKFSKSLGSYLWHSLCKIIIMKTSVYNMQMKWQSFPCVAAIILGVILGILVLILLALYKRISIAIQIIKEGSRYDDCTHILPWMSQHCVVVNAIYVFMHLMWIVCMFSFSFKNVISFALVGLYLPCHLVCFSLLFLGCSRSYCLDGLLVS